MLEVLTDEFPDFIQECFDKMQIPGDGTGIAVFHRGASKEMGAALGRTADGGTAVRFEGKECANPRRRTISGPEYLQLASLLNTQFRRAGFVGAEDILDGESYLVKWSEGGKITQLVLCNPRATANVALRDFTDKLDRLIELV